MELRLFVAIELPEVWTAALAAVQRELRGPLPGLRWSRPEGIHLTLKFLGNVDSTRVAELGAALAGAATACPPFTLRLGPLGSFGSAARARVLWAGVEGDRPALERLWRSVEGRLQPLGFVPEERRFSPHLTLARVPEERARETGAALGRLLAAVTLPDTPELEVRQIALMRSELGAGGSRYTRLASGILRVSDTNRGKDPDPKALPPVV